MIRCDKRHDQVDRSGSQHQRFLRVELSVDIVSWQSAAAVQLESEARAWPGISETKKRLAAI